MAAIIVVLLFLAIICGMRMIKALATGQSDAISPGESMFQTGCGCVGILFTLAVFGICLTLAAPAMLAILLAVAGLAFVGLFSRREKD